MLLVVALVCPVACAPTLLSDPENEVASAQAGTASTAHLAGASGTGEDGSVGTDGGASGGSAVSAAGTTPADDDACPVGYVSNGADCVWSNPIQSPDFDTGEGWTRTGSAQVDTAGGWGVFSPEAICFGGALSQEVAMPPADEAMPMALTFRARRARAEGGPTAFGAVVNGRLHAVELRYDTRWVENTVCLGEGDYGGPLTIAFERYSANNYCDADPIHIDNVAIGPAEASACPAPGVVLDGSFDMKSPRWTGSTGTAFNGSAAVITGSPCDYLLVQGKASVPVPSTAPHPAFAIAYSSEGLSGDSTLLLTLEGFAVGTLMPRATPGTTNVCVPPWARGGVHAVAVTMQDPFGGPCITEARATIESIELIQDPDCTDFEPIDGGFEGVHLSAGRAWRYGLTDKGIVPGAVESTNDAHSGSNALPVDISYPCGTAGAIAVVTSPKALVQEGPALTYWYRLPRRDRAKFSVCAGASCSEYLAISDEWRKGKVCIDPWLGGLPLEVTLLGEGGDGSCQESFASEVAWFDDLALATDAECPVD
jgi:hypothetical protein